MRFYEEHKKQPIKVFLSDVSSDVQTHHQHLHKILAKAGFDVLTTSHNLHEAISKSDCSVHLIGQKYEESNRDGLSLSPTEEQFKLVQRNFSENDPFKIFVWQPFGDKHLQHDTRQVNFINTLQNSVLQNMVYSKQSSPVLFVEDMRSLMQTDLITEQKTTETDIFFIHNELDEDTATETVEILADVLSVERLSVATDTDLNYSELIVQQLQKSKLAVIFFEKTANWAIPFVQQVWRKIGGASSPIEILLIGDANEPSNYEHTFNAPKVHSLTISKELAPLEIKVQFDKIVGNG